MEKIPSDIALGSDMELFLFDNEKGKIVPCVGILDGTKEEPYKPAGYGEGYAIQEDNVMVEFNIPPATNFGAFYKSMRKGKRMILEELKRRYGSRYGLWNGGHTHKFQARDLTSRQAKCIGCEPDRNAYEGGATRLQPPAPGLHRACGGHIHLGGDFKCPDFVAALFAELYLGVQCQLYAQQDDERAKWYGKPGIYRSKPYGIEYRTPSNKWGQSNQGIELVGSLGLQCAQYLTETDAITLQRAFRAIPWVKVRKYMLASKRTKTAKQLYGDVLRAAHKAGVQI